MGNTIHNIHAKASLPCVHLPVIAIAGGKGVTYWPDDVPEAIRKSCVLWYDPARQGCTNESMATNPVLKDLSGNGHYARCYNFAWSGMSGIGGYNVDFSTFTGKYGTINGNVVTIDTTNSDITDWLWTSQIDYNGSPFKVNCTFIEVDSNPNNYVLTFQRPGGTNIYLCSEGYNEVPAISGDEGSKLQFSTFGKVKIIIEFIPEYPNALVSDGVDDYCLVEGLPLLTKERGFTVLAKRKWISDINSKSQGFATKGTSTDWIDGAFYFECVEGNGLAPFNRVFDNSNGQKGVNYISNFTENDITYLTSKEYNGSPLNKIGDAVDTDRLSLFKLPSSNPTLLSSIALYSFILFDRDLTDNEIEWVKTNILGGSNQ